MSCAEEAAALAVSCSWCQAAAFLVCIALWVLLSSLESPAQPDLILFLSSHKYCSQKPFYDHYNEQHRECEPVCEWRCWEVRQGRRCFPHVSGCLWKVPDQTPPGRRGWESWSWESLSCREETAAAFTIPSIDPKVEALHFFTNDLMDQGYI